MPLAAAMAAARVILAAAATCGDGCDGCGLAAACGAPQRLLEGLGVETDLALVDDAAAVGMEDLDRVLDRDDVLLARAIDVVDYGRERRGLARAGRSRD